MKRNSLKRNDAKKKLLFSDINQTTQGFEPSSLEGRHNFKRQKLDNTDDLVTLDESSNPTKITTDLVTEEHRQIPKEVLANLLKGAIHYKLPNTLLADITGSSLTVVGRAKIPGTKNQLCHIIPVVFIKEMVETVIKETAQNQELLEKLSLILTTAAKSQSGFAVSSSNFELVEYNNIASKIESCANRVLNLEKENIFLVSPSKQKTLFSTPKKMQKAANEFQEYNSRFIKLALSKLSELVQDDNTALIVSELLTRYIFSLPNSGKNTVFAPEGNTARYEIRLYEYQEDAENGNKDYEIFTAQELKKMPREFLSKYIRIVDSEGANIKSYVKALTQLKNILISLDDQSLFTDDCKLTYDNKPIKLANYEGDLSEYNNYIIINECVQNQVSFHIAKNLYQAFDLKALENLVFVPGGNIPVYVSAEGKRVVKYGFKSGTEYRQTKMDESNYSNDTFFRSSEKDIELLPQKLAELFLIGISTFASYQIHHSDFVDLCLNKLIELAAKDYCMNLEANQIFSNQVQDIYRSLLPPAELSVDYNPTIKLLGKDFMECNKFLALTSGQSADIHFGIEF